MIDHVEIPNGMTIYLGEGLQFVISHPGQEMDGFKEVPIEDAKEALEKLKVVVKEEAEKSFKNLPETQAILQYVNAQKALAEKQLIDTAIKRLIDDGTLPSDYEWPELEDQTNNRNRKH